MNGQDFISNALRTEAVPERVEFSITALTLLLEASVEMAKIVDTAKKTLIYGKELDVTAFRNQIIFLRGTLERLQQRPNYGRDDTPVPGLAEPNVRLLHGTIGMFGEAGELIEAIVKGMRGAELDLVNLAEETGDSDWYKAIIHDETGVSEEQAREKVIAKLRVRYGDKFSSEAALNRDLAAERAVLEASVPVLTDKVETEAEATTVVSEGVGFVEPNEVVSQG